MQPVYNLLIGRRIQFNRIAIADVLLFARVNRLPRNPVIENLLSFYAKRFANLLFQLFLGMRNGKRKLLHLYHTSSFAACMPATYPDDHAHCKL